MEDELLQAAVLEASISDPNDKFETTIIGNAASVGTTTELFGTGKRVKWDADQLEKYAPTFKDMPITLELGEDGSPVPHSKTIIGRIKDVYFDKNENKVAYAGALWKHYFPETIDRLNEMMASEDDKPEVSWEFVPTGLDDLPDEGENVVTPTGGRFAGLAIVKKGADLGNSIALLAASAKAEADKATAERTVDLRPGSFEWLGTKIVSHLTAASSEDTFVPFTVLATYPDHTVFNESGKYFKLPYTIKGNEIEFSDTIEVEPVYQPLGASATGSTNPEVTPPPKVEETKKKTMAEIEDTELEALKASATKKTELEAENSTLKQEIETLQASKQELEDLKAANAQKEEEDRLNTLAASRIGEVEKIAPYKDQKQKDEDLEAFKSMDEKAFDIVKRTLVAAAEVRGGVAAETHIDPPATREDPDGKAADILGSDEYKALLAAHQPPKEDK